MDPNADERVLLLLRLGRPADAEAAARDLIARAPNSFTGYYYLACALAGRDRVAEALDASAAALARAPDSAVVHGHRSALLLTVDRVAEATEAAENALRLDPADPDNHRYLVNAHIFAGRSAAARAILADARRQFPADLGLLHQAALLAWIEKRTDELAALARDGLARAPDDARFHTLAGVAASLQARERFPDGPKRQRQFQEAERILAEAVRREPTDAVCRTMRKQNAADSRGIAIGVCLMLWLVWALLLGLIGPLAARVPHAAWWVWVPATFAVWFVGVVMYARYPEFSLVVPLFQSDVVTIPLLPEERRLGRRLWATFGLLTVALLVLPSLLFGR